MELPTVMFAFGSRDDDDDDDDGDSDERVMVEEDETTPEERAAEAQKWIDAWRASLPPPSSLKEEENTIIAEEKVVTKEEEVSTTTNVTLETAFFTFGDEEEVAKKEEKKEKKKSTPPPKTTKNKKTEAKRATRSGKSYYKIIAGVKYDRKVLDDCEEFELNNGSIDLTEAKRIMEDILDGPMRPIFPGSNIRSTVTNIELTTAFYALATWKWDDDAREWFSNKIAEIRRESGRD